MTGRSSCYFYFSFAIHFVGFSALLVGYCTPYWTMVKLSTGEVISDGLVVSCERNSCVLLHISKAKTVIIVVFGMCTTSLMISVFVLQIFAMASCNQSCKARNLGSALSYLSFIIAVMNGVSVALYHLDQSSQIDFAYKTVSIGWSQCSVICSALLYLLGAFTTAADNAKRNRAILDEVIILRANHLTTAEGPGHKRDEVRRNILNMVDKASQTASHQTRETSSNFKSAVQTVGAAVRLKTLKTDSITVVRNNDNTNSNTSRNKFVSNNQRGPFNSTGNDVKAGMTMTCLNTSASSVNPSDKNIDNNLRKSRLVKTAHVTSIDVSKTLPEVEVESEATISHVEAKIGGIRSKSQISIVNSLRDNEDGKLRLRPDYVSADLPRAHSRKGSVVEEALLTVSHLLNSAKRTKKQHYSSDPHETYKSAERSQSLNLKE